MITNNLHIKSFVGFLFLLLATASCSNDEEAIVMPSSEGVKLEVTTEDNDKASTRTAGDNSLNENLFVTLDYFFFGANDDNATLKVRLSEESLADNTRHVYNGRRLTDKELKAAFGKEITELVGGEKSYVYVVANLDETTRSNIASNITLGDLKKTTFQTEDISKNGAQASFVMYGGANVTLSVTGTGTDRKMSLSGQVRVKRDASKVVLTVTEVNDTVHIGNDDAYQVWQSNPDYMHVMFYNGVNKSMINSQIDNRYHYKPTGVNDDCYFTLDGKEQDSTNPWRILNQGSGNTNRTHQYPFYTYLSDWSVDNGIKERASYMILMVPWKQIAEKKTGQEREIAVSGGDFEYTYYQIETTLPDEHAYYENTFYQLLLKVGVVGSFELPEPVVVNAQYMVVPWGTVDVPGTLREGRYLILETNKYTVNNQPSGSIPFVTSHKITQAYVTNVNYLALRSFRSVNTPNTDDTDGTLTVNTYRENSDSEGSQTIRNLQETFTVTTTNNILTLSHDIKPNQYTRYEVTVKIVNEAGLSEEAVFTIYPAIYVDNNKGKGGNSFINGYFGHVSPLPPHANNGTWSSNGDGSYRVRENTGNNPTHIWAGGAYNYNGNNNEANTYGSLITGDPGLTGTTFTKITITSFTADDESFTIRDEGQGRNETYTYKIADPRVASGWSSNDLHPFVVTASSRYDRTYTTQNWTGNYDAGKIMIGTAERDKLAPEILVTSVWGRCNPNSITFEQAQKRCATYQEAGYPAGRWRLPTVAEISYIYTLQDRDVINDLFNPGHSDGYWSSEGHPMRYRNIDTYPSLRTDYSGKDPLRCVYDLWYWGDEQMSEKEYHAMPTKNNN